MKVPVDIEVGARGAKALCCKCDVTGRTEAACAARGNIHNEEAARDVLPGAVCCYRATALQFQRPGNVDKAGHGVRLNAAQVDPIGPGNVDTAGHGVRLGAAQVDHIEYTGDSVLLWVGNSF